VLTKNKPRLIVVGLVGRNAKTVQLSEVKVHAADATRAEAMALRIYRRAFPSAKWEAIAL
jgi:hypothetical protein